MSRLINTGPYLGYVVAIIAAVIIAACAQPAPAYAAPLTPPPAAEELHPLEMACYSLTEYAAIIYQAHEAGYPEAFLIQALDNDEVLNPEAKAVVESYIRARYHYLEGLDISLPEFLGAAYQYCLLTLKPVASKVSA